MISILKDFNLLFFTLNFSLRGPSNEFMLDGISCGYQRTDRGRKRHFLLRVRIVSGNTLYGSAWQRKENRLYQWENHQTETENIGWKRLLAAEIKAFVSERLNAIFELNRFLLIFFVRCAWFPLSSRNNMKFWYYTENSYFQIILIFKKFKILAFKEWENIFLYIDSSVEINLIFN